MRKIIFITLLMLTLIAGCETNEGNQLNNEPGSKQIKSTEPPIISENDVEATHLAIDSIPYNVSYKGAWELLNSSDTHARYSSGNNEILIFDYTGGKLK
jgi:hypothetical protein